MFEGEEYIDDPESTGSLGAVRHHQERLEGVYEELSAMGDEYPTIGFAGNSNWYRYTDIATPAAIEGGWDAKGRVKTLGRDWDRILDEDLSKDERNLPSRNDGTRGGESREMRVLVYGYSVSCTEFSGL